MKNINAILDEFLEEQKTRLKERTFRDYEDVIFLFREYLNGYAYQYLDDENRKKWEAQWEEGEAFFTELFGQDELTENQISEFLDYFLIRKVMGPESLIKKAVRVMKKFSKWMNEKNYSKDDYQDYFEEVKDLPKVEKLAQLIYHCARNAPELQYEDVINSSFLVSKIEKGKLWLEDDLDGTEVIGPVLVTKGISDLCQEGWRINMEIGKTSKGWYILESGNVYRY
ncbi:MULTISPECIES: hypothetical protein [Bacillaceae]|uniref:Core-binding (CB) domain-containing protein n=1 Tax=Oceanobacillus caeni TaxID=405946 RepID=A0ABR5MHH9_9BACI|nr:MULTISPECIES: hypothetical protein [Bacillaceae]KPH73474.1 hypothetical protein AFL42_12395 [Oceanobacillus caeni]MED4474238.1 hypothetical protein [Oceanobacillus caeni]